MSTYERHSKPATVRIAHGAADAQDSYRQGPRVSPRRRSRYSGSLATGLTIVSCFGDPQGVLGIVDIAEMLGTTRSTTHRYVTTFVALGWLEQTKMRRYQLAPACMRPGMALLEEIVLGTGCEPILCELREQSGHTVSLGVLDGSRVTYVRRLFAHGRGQHGADGELRAGAHVPLHCTALGKALLANVPEEELWSLLAAIELDRRTSRTITFKKGLREEIGRVRSAGLAVSDREFAADMCSVAAAVSVPYRDRWLAVDVSVPAAAYTVVRLRRELGSLIAVAAERISKHLRDRGEGDEDE